MGEGLPRGENNASFCLYLILPDGQGVIYCVTNYYKFSGWNNWKLLSHSLVPCLGSQTTKINMLTGAVISLEAQGPLPSFLVIGQFQCLAVGGLRFHLLGFVCLFVLQLLSAARGCPHFLAMWPSPKHGSLHCEGQ